MSSTPRELIADSLAVCAEQIGDVTEAVFTGFFARCPQAAEVMAHSDAPMRGRMMAGLIEFMLAGMEADDGAYLRWEVENHIQAYDVYGDMYEPLLLALRDTVQAGLGDRWTAALDAAWQADIDAIVRQVQAEAARLGTATA